MEGHHVVLILLTGVAMGWINNLAGAAGALGLIAFEYLLGMEPMEANASIRLSALAIGLFGLIGFLSKNQKIPPKIWGYALLTSPGAVAGSLLDKPQFTLLFQLTLAGLLLLAIGQTLGNKSGGACGVRVGLLRSVTHPRAVREQRDQANDDSRNHDSPG